MQMTAIAKRSLGIERQCLVLEELIYDGEKCILYSQYGKNGFVEASWLRTVAKICNGLIA